MSKQSYLCHLKNKYPFKDGYSISASGHSISVYDKEGDLICCVEKGAHGALECKKEEYGARDYFSLDPNEVKEEKYYLCPKSNKVLKKEEKKSEPPKA